MAAYSAAWAGRGLANFPAGATYPGGAGSPFPYNTVNSDGAVGGNPSITPFLTGPVIPANPEERGWKDAIKALPGEVATYICRLAPTDKPINATAAQLVYPFDPSLGPGYVWHCHIIDHEDMDMMRPMPISPSPQRFPQVGAQPVPVIACAGDIATFNATATNAISYKWQVRLNGSTVWTNITDGAPGPYTNSLTATLSINPVSTTLTANRYHCIITNPVGITTTSSGLLTVNNCAISGTLKYNNTALDPLPGMTVTANGKSAVVDATGAYSITGVTSGSQTLILTPGISNTVRNVNATDAGTVNYWASTPSAIEHVKFLTGDVNGDNAITSTDAVAIQNYFVSNQPFARTPWSFWKAAGTIAANTDLTVADPVTVSVTGNSVNLDLMGMATGDFNGNLNPLAVQRAGTKLQLTYSNTLKISPAQDFDLPLRTVSPLQLGAVSLIMTIPTDLVEVKDVVIKGTNDKPAFNLKGNELRIGWYSLTPLNLQAAAELITLKLKTTPAFVEGKSIKVVIDTVSMNEFATGSFTVIPQAVLNTDVFIGVPTGLPALSGYPNPFKDVTTLSYTLTADATVSLKVYNVLGMVVKNLVDVHQTAATYSVKLDASTLKRGTYSVILRINDNTKITERTIKIVVSK
jgi:hypothetical protein